MGGHLKNNHSVRERGRFKKVIALLIIALMLVPFGWFLPLIISDVQNFIWPSPYTRIIVSGITQARKIGNDSYSFAYPLGSQNQSEAGEFAVFRDVSNPAFFKATVGATYQAFGLLEIKVSEVNRGYVVLLVKPL
jgi:hypothetical protein